jgi:hypothetical protein
MLMRAVSFFGPAWIEPAGLLSEAAGTDPMVALDPARTSEPGGFGKGRKRGETVVKAGGGTGAQR